jgi:hypothetical protein
MPFGDSSAPTAVPSTTTTGRSRRMLFDGGSAPGALKWGLGSDEESG